MAHFRDILKNKNFFCLWLSQVISNFGDRLNQMALVAFIHQRAPGSTFQMARLLSFTIIPVFLIGPIAGVYVDRWSRKRIMIISDILRGALVFLIPLVLVNLKTMLPMYLVVFLVFSITRFFLPSKLAIIPDIVPKEKLLLANSLTSTTGMIAAILGFGFGGLIVAAVGMRWGFYIDAASFFVSALITGFISINVPSGRWREGFALMRQGFKEAIRRSVLSDIKEGARYIATHKDTQFVSLVLFLLMSGAGAVYVVLIVFIQNTLGSATRDLGLLVVSLGIGLLSGTLLCGRFGQGFSRYRAIFVSFILSGFILASFAMFIHNVPSFWLASGMFFLLGLALSPIMVYSNTLIHEASPNEIRGRTFSWVEIIIHLGFLTFMFLTAVLAEYIGRRNVLIGSGAMFAAAGLFGLLMARQIRIRNAASKDLGAL